LPNQPGEVLEGAVVGRFGLGRETASRELAAYQVVGQAFAAEALSRAGVVGALAPLEVLFLATIHPGPSLAAVGRSGIIAEERQAQQPRRPGSSSAAAGIEIKNICYPRERRLRG